MTLPVILPLLRSTIKAQFSDVCGRQITSFWPLRRLFGRRQVILGALVPVGGRDGADLKAPERKSLTEAAGQSGCAGVKLRQQMAFVGKRQGPGDEERGALCSGSLCGSD